MAEIHQIKLKTLAPIWTGGINPRNGRKLHLTGIKGSIRWWYEALIRGLGGYACDPTAENKCELKMEELKKQRKSGTPEEEILNQLKICPVCQVFGCTNWSSKFIIRIKDKDGNVITSLHERDKSFVLEFIERKKLLPNEKNLIYATIKLIVKHGAIGGKTVLKPSETSSKNGENYRKKSHIDYGIIDFDYSEGGKDDNPYKEKLINDIKPYKILDKENDASWPDLRRFWFVDGQYINRVEHNNVVKQLSDMKEWLAGNKGISKKIFSFHGLVNPNKSNNVTQSFTPRCFGYTKNETDFKSITDKIKEILKGKKYTLKTGREVLDEL